MAHEQMIHRGFVKLRRYHAGQAVYCFVHQGEVEARLAQGWEQIKPEPETELEDS